MKKDTVSVGIAVAIAMFAGGFISEDLLHTWLLGSLAGGLIGYLGCNFREVTAAAKRTGAEVIHELRGFNYSQGFKDVMRYLGTKLYYGFRCLTVALSNFLNVTIGICLAIRLVGGQETGKHLLEGFNQNYALIGSVVLVMSTFFILGSPWNESSIEKNRLGPNPFKTWLWVVPKFFLWTIWAYSLPRLWLAVKFTARHAKVFLRRIHSNARLLCGSYSATGVAIMHFRGVHTVAGLALGALIGAAVAMLVFETVSKRLMKLAEVPVRNS